MAESKTNFDHVLIVAGSRVFDDNASSHATVTAHEMLEDRLKRMSENTLVASGGARKGPDQWTTDLMRAMNRERMVRLYDLSGDVKLPSGRVIRSWVPESPAVHPADRKRWPLYRNEMMLKDLKDFAVDNEIHIEVFGLEATWSMTHGTANTLTKAASMGIRIVETRFQFSE